MPTPKEQKSAYALMNPGVTVKLAAQLRLERANIKLALVVSDVMGVSSRAILAALVDGRAAPATMAELARGRLRSKIPL